MRGFSKILAAGLVAAAFAAPAPAAGFGGGPPGGGGPGVILPPNGVVGAPPQHGPSGPRPGGPGPNVFTPRIPAGPNGVLRQWRPGATPPPRFTGRGPGQGWRNRPRHYWPGNGPIFTPQPSGDYLFGAEDYDDGSDASDCWVYRKAYDRAGHFLGWARFDLCDAQ